MNTGTRMTAAGAFAHLSTLSDVVEEYKKHFDFEYDDDVVPFCAKSRDLTEAIDRACDGKRPNGKMHAKGSCVLRSALEEIRAKLHDNEQFLYNAPSFEYVYDLIHAIAPKGIGPLWKYMLAERVGAYLGVKPERYLYLHAGPAISWSRLNGIPRSKVPSRVPVDQLPKPLRELNLHHVENLLCEFREVLQPNMIATEKKDGQESGGEASIRSRAGC